MTKPSNRHGEQAREWDMLSNPPGPSSYSYLRASMGSNRLARQAG